MYLNPIYFPSATDQDYLNNSLSDCLRDCRKRQENSMTGQTHSENVRYSEKMLGKLCTEQSSEQ